MIIGILCETQQDGLHVYHRVGEKYMKAITDITQAIPLLIPALSTDVSVHKIAHRIDGLLCPGGYSNIERQNYGLDPAPSTEIEDPQKDRMAFHMIKAMVDMNKPILAICRGMQELNVAYGGTLHPRLQEVTGRIDHRENKQYTIDQQYGPSHEILLNDGSLLKSICKTSRFRVNSLHGQGINRLAEDFIVEAVAPDRTIEAIRHKDKNFVVGVQWHPEWQALKNEQSLALFKAFHQACAISR